MPEPKHNVAANNRGSIRPKEQAQTELLDWTKLQCDRDFDPSGGTKVRAALAALGSLEAVMQAVILEGRGLPQTNASINGVYQRCPEDAHGFRCYKRIYGPVPCSGDRLLSYDPKRRRWKVSNDLGTAPGYAFAFTPGEKDGAPVTTRSLVWFVYEGKGIDYLPDEGVRVASTVEGYLNTMRIM